MIEIRPGSEADSPAIARVRRDSWRAAYTGIVAAPVIDRITATGGAATAPPPYRRTLVAEVGEHPAVIGYASFGPERAIASVSWSWNSPARAQPAAAPSAAASSAPAAAAVAPSAAGADRGGACGKAGPDPLTADGRAGIVGELYALYVTPAWWSAGAGRALMDRVLTSLEADGYRRAVLWVLAGNGRARRFYERAGFTPDGGTHILSGLGGILELRYSREL